MNCEALDISQIIGLKVLIRISITMAAGRAIFSGFLAANVFGAVSANIKITKVSTSEAIMTEPSPHSLIARMVVILAARILTKLLPSRMAPIKRSTSFKSLSTLFAFALFLALSVFKR